MEKHMEAPQTQRGTALRSSYPLLGISPEETGTSEYTVMSETVRSFKPLAKELNIVPIVLSQLNREGRPWEKPNLAQMKGGGDIEATADWIIGMWRDGENPALSLEEQESKQDIINMAILKGRRRCGQRDFKYMFDAEETSYRPV